MKKIFKLLFSRYFILALLIIVQFAAIFVPLYLLNFNSFFFSVVFWIIGLFVVLYIVRQDTEPSFKLTWSIVILLFPLFGSGIYFIFGDKQHVNKSIKKSHNYTSKTHHLLINQARQNNVMLDHSNSSKSVVNYLQHEGFPAFKNTKTKFFPWGQDKFKDLIEDLKSAKNFIFLEYFIINEGYMWDSIVDILKEKVKEGVEVRVMYDGFGCLFTLPSNYPSVLESYGIKTRIFNKIKPMITFKINNRDHRKICVIDGKVGYCGGINLADEYINKIDRFGVWKDTAIKITGDAVFSLTFMFLQTWNSIEDDNEEYIRYYIPNNEVRNDSLVVPYGSDPTYKETIGENVYIKILSQAKDYVYLTTPYLIIDDRMTNALILAAKSGIDVRIITPGIFDKKMVSWITQSSYKRLLEAGIRIFEYTKGFVHAKQYVCDDMISVVGTINMDYRSFYHHYECATFIEDANVALDVKTDILNTIKECREIKIEDTKEYGFIKRLLVDILNIFAPLL